MSRYKKYKETYQAYDHNHRKEIRERRIRWEQENPNYYNEYRKRNPESFVKSRFKWRQQNTERDGLYKRIWKHPEDYPLANQCVFCGRTSELEHAHLDYEDEGQNYVTACHQCNYWMDKP